MQVKIKNQLFNQGDYVVADIVVLQTDDYYQEIEIKFSVLGRLFIKENKIVYICQNEIDGKSCEQCEKYGYDFSWIVYLNEDNTILSKDTKNIRLASFEEVVDHLKKINYYQETKT